jgi:hypothetical protein
MQELAYPNCLTDNMNMLLNVGSKKKKNAVSNGSRIVYLVCGASLAVAILLIATCSHSRKILIVNNSRDLIEVRINGGGETIQVSERSLRRTANSHYISGPTDIEIQTKSSGKWILYRLDSAQVMHRLSGDLFVIEYPFLAVDQRSYPGP